MAWNYGSSIKEACELLDKIRTDPIYVDYSLEDVSKDLKDVDAPQKKFLLDVVSGCTKYKKLLDVVVTTFCGQNRIWVSKNDHSQFIIVCYLTIFALDELGLKNFSSIIKSLGMRKMHLFLNFFFSNLTSWIQDEWSSIYDADFVEKEWIEPLLRWRPEINALMDQLTSKISQESQVTKAPWKTTQPREFNLSKPEPRPLPLSEPILLQEKFKPVPKSTYTAYSEILNTKERKCETENASCLVKLNNAAFLRREALFHHQLEKELQSIEQLAQGAGDPSFFLQQQEMLKRDRQEEMLANKQKCLKVRISEEKIAVIRKQITDSNQKAAQQKREETAQLMQEYAEKRMQEEKELRDLVQQVASGSKNSKAAKEKLQKLKQNIVKEVSKESQELLRQALEDQQDQICRKFQIIHEIHFLESCPRIRFNSFDDTETAGHKLLVEMSLAELKERLALLKLSQQTQQEVRRTQILEEKKRKKEQMEKTFETIELHRRELVKASTQRKEDKRASEERLQQLLDQDANIVALRKKLEEQKQERQQLKLSEKSKKKVCKQTPAQSKTRNQKIVKWKSWEEVEQDLERDVQDAYDSSS